MVTIIVNESDENKDDNEFIKRQDGEGIFISEKTDEAILITQKDKIVTKEINHIVVKGDTLWHIALRYINNPYRYPELARLSKIKNPDLIYPGDQVRIIVNGKKQ